MRKNSSTLATEHSVRHVGAVVTICITDSPHTRQRSPQTRVRLRVDLVIQHLEAKLVGDSRALRSVEVSDESVALDGLTLGEVHEELVELAALVVLVGFAVLDALDLGDGAVVEADVVRFHDVPPVGVGLGQNILLLGGVSAIQEGNEVVVQGSVHLKGAANDILQSTQDTERLVPVFVAIAPGAPEDTLAESFLQTGGVREDVTETSAQDDLAGRVGLAGGIGGFKDVLDGLDGGNGSVDDGGGVVTEDLLAGGATEFSGDGSCLH